MDGWVLLVLYKGKGRMGPISPIQGQGKDGSVKSYTRTRELLSAKRRVAEIFFRLRVYKKNMFYKTTFIKNKNNSSKYLKTNKMFGLVDPSLMLICLDW